MNKKQKQSFAIVFIAGLALLIGWGIREDRRISREDHAEEEQ